jgi:hypothetical protein
MPDLCELEDAKAWLGITDTLSDTLLRRLISSTSQDFLNEIRRNDFTPAQDWTEHLFKARDYWWMGADGLRSFWQGPGLTTSQRRNAIFLRHYPINTVASVTLDGTALTAVTDPNDLTQSGFWFDPSLDPENRQKIDLVGISTIGQGWDNPLGNVVIAYNAGYDDIPENIEQAIIEWVAMKRGQSQLQSVNQAAGGFKLGDYEQTQAISGLTLAALAAQIPENVQKIIEQYKRPLPF